MPEEYTYDVFISYRRKDPVMGWMKHHFFPLLEQWLPNCLPVEHELKIFIDWEIETGAEWPLTLRQALKTSRCLLAIWSPEYFRSPWCLAELQSMMARERSLSLRTENNPAGLVYPIRFFDGEHFPQEAQQIQMRDLTAWNSQFLAFRQTAGIVDFEREMQYVCQELSQMIQGVPDWQDWPVVTPPTPAPATMKLPRLK